MVFRNRVSVSVSGQSLASGNARLAPPLNTSACHPMSYCQKLVSFQAARSRGRCGPAPCRFQAARIVLQIADAAAMKAVTSISTACAKRRCAPERKTAVKGSSENDPGWRSSTTLSSLMAYPFLMGIGDSASPGYAAFNSSRHQLSGIALIRSGGTSARGHERRRGGLSRHSRAYGLSGIDDRW